MAKHFQLDMLPNDRRMMADVIRRYIEIGGIDLVKLDELLSNAEETNNKILDLLTVTPIDKVFLLIFLNEPERVKGKLQTGRHKVLITEEMGDFFPNLKAIENQGRVKFLQ